MTPEQVADFILKSAREGLIEEVSKVGNRPDDHIYVTISVEEVKALLSGDHWACENAA